MISDLRMTHTRTISQLRKQKRVFLSLRDERDLAQLLRLDTYQLQLMGLQPKYRLFSVPKRNGAKRWIEDPHPKLKALQQVLNDCLQSVYFFQRSRAAYGFLVNPKRDPEPRNVLTNVERHQAALWLWNGDLKDFFHQVKWERVHGIFTKAPFSFDGKLAALLSDLCCHQGRLPMGAATSPILSNFATLELDDQLGNLADWAGWTYTRFADDLSFSGTTAFSEEGLGRIRAIVEEEGFEFNEKKFRLYGPEEVKEVTGLHLVDGQIRIPDVFLEELEDDLRKLDAVLEVQYRSGQEARWVERFRQQVEGRLNFVQLVMGKRHALTKKLAAKMEKALHIPEEIEPVGWLNFHYF